VSEGRTLIGPFYAKPSWEFDDAGQGGAWYLFQVWHAGTLTLEDHPASGVDLGLRTSPMRYPDGDPGFHFQPAFTQQDAANRTFGGLADEAAEGGGAMRVQTKFRSALFDIRKPITLIGIVTWSYYVEIKRDADGDVTFHPDIGKVEWVPP